jgi:hypothetical protein
VVRALEIGRDDERAVVALVMGRTRFGRAKRDEDAVHAPPSGRREFDRGALGACRIKKYQLRVLCEPPLGAADLRR